MATNYPNSIDSITNPSSNNPLSNPSHSEQHIIANTAIEAIETKIGIDGSTDTNSIDYRLAQLETESGPTIAQKLGLDGNNDLAVTGIENKTVVDSLDSSIWQSATYSIQITKGSDTYTSKINVLFTQGGVNITESDIITSNDSFNNPATVNFEYNNSIINLTVTPISGTVSVRFFRTALKK